MAINSNLSSGLAYLELKSAYKTAYSDNKLVPGAPLMSRNGEPMILLKWSIVDSIGNQGIIDDYITPSMVWKIRSIENAFGFKGFYDKISLSFNPSFLEGRACGAAIKEEDPKYGYKIAQYVPMEFYKMVIKEKEKLKETTNEVSESSSLSTPSTDVVEDLMDDLPF